MEKKTFLKTFNSTDRQCWCFLFNFRVFLLFEQRTAAPAAGIGSVGRLPMDADVQGGKIVQISRSQALLLPLPRPFSCGMADHVWAVHAMWATDFYLLLTNSLSLSDLYFYTVYIYVLYLHVFYSRSQREYAPVAVTKLTLLIQSYLCPIPLQEQLSPGSPGGDVHGDLFAAWELRSVGKERHSLLNWETGELRSCDGQRVSKNPISLLSLSSCTSLFSFLHTLPHVPPPSTTRMFFFIHTLTTSAAKFKFLCTWRSCASQPLKFFQFNKQITSSGILTSKMWEWKTSNIGKNKIPVVSEMKSHSGGVASCCVSDIKDCPVRNHLV